MASRNPYGPEPYHTGYAGPTGSSAHPPHLEDRVDYSPSDVRIGRQDPLDRYAQGAAHRAGFNGRAGRQGDPARVRAYAPRNDDHFGPEARPYEDRSRQYGNPQFSRPRDHGGYGKTPQYVADQHVGRAMDWQEHDPRVEAPYGRRARLPDEAAGRGHLHSTPNPESSHQVGQPGPVQDEWQSMAHEHHPPPRQQNYVQQSNSLSAAASSSLPHGRSNVLATSRPGTPSRQRILDDMHPPDTVSWDNPFPSFPAVKKRKEQTTPRNELEDPLGKLSLGNESASHQSRSSRPQTASSKGSHSQSINGNRATSELELMNTQPDLRSNVAQPPRVTHPAGPSSEMGRAAYQETYQDHQNMDRYENHTARPYQSSLQSPPLVTRHSEDGRSVPQPKYDRNPIVDTQRSRTMPSAVERPENGYRTLPVSPVSPPWQEQGPTAGYYGPEDKPFLSNTESGVSQVQSQAAFKSPYGTVQSRSVEQPPPAVDEDAFADVYDSYSRDPDQNSEVHWHGPDRSNHPANQGSQLDRVDQDTKQAAHRRGHTIDKHLEPGLNAEHVPPMPHAHQIHGDTAARVQDQRIQYVSRSRSQPDLNNGRPPPGSGNGQFDFHLPQSPPATAPAPLSHQGEAFRDAVPRGGRINAQRTPNGTVVHAGNRPPPMNGYYDRNQQSHEQDLANQHRPGASRLPSAAGYANSDFHSRSAAESRRDPIPGPIPNGKHLGDSGNSSRDSPGNIRGLPSSSSVTGMGYNRVDVDPRRSPGNPRGPASAPSGYAPNPDTLPAHPVPVRSGSHPEHGLRHPQNRGPNANQYSAQSRAGPNDRPTPVRNYNHDHRPPPGQPSQNSRPPPVRNYEYQAPPSGPMANGSIEGKAPRSDRKRPDQKRQSIPITVQELQKRRQAATVDPGNLEIQFSFGKGLAEAADVLVESVDVKDRPRERERYNGEALRIMKKLASEQHSEAMFFLGDCYSQGRIGLAMDAKEAFTLYQSAAKAGHAASAFRVAVCCEMGLEEGGGTKRDLQKAIQWYTRAATLGDTPAMYKVGIIQLKGLLSQPANPTEALHWLGKAAQRADAENPHALHELVSLVYPHLIPSSTS